MADRGEDDLLQTIKRQFYDQRESIYKAAHDKVGVTVGNVKKKLVFHETPGTIQIPEEAMDEFQTSSSDFDCLGIRTFFSSCPDMRKVKGLLHKLFAGGKSEKAALQQNAKDGQIVAALGKDREGKDIYVTIHVGESTTSNKVITGDCTMTRARIQTAMAFEIASICKQSIDGGGSGMFAIASANGLGALFKEQTDAVQILSSFFKHFEVEYGMDKLPVTYMPKTGAEPELRRCTMHEVALVASLSHIRANQKFGDFISYVMDRKMREALMAFCGLVNCIVTSNTQNRMKTQVVGTAQAGPPGFFNGFMKKAMNSGVTINIDKMIAAINDNVVLISKAARDSGGDTARVTDLLQTIMSSKSIQEYANAAGNIPESQRGFTMQITEIAEKAGLTDDDKIAFCSLIGDFMELVRRLGLTTDIISHRGSHAMERAYMIPVLGWAAFLFSLRQKVKLSKVGPSSAMKIIESAAGRVGVDSDVSDKLKRVASAAEKISSQVKSSQLKSVLEMTTKAQNTWAFNVACPLILLVENSFDLTLPQNIFNDSNNAKLLNETEDFMYNVARNAKSTGQVPQGAAEIEAAVRLSEMPDADEDEELERERQRIREMKEQEEEGPEEEEFQDASAESASSSARRKYPDGFRAILKPEVENLFNENLKKGNWNNFTPVYMAMYIAHLADYKTKNGLFVELTTSERAVSVHSPVEVPKKLMNELLKDPSPEDMRREKADAGDTMKHVNSDTFRKERGSFKNDIHTDLITSGRDVPPNRRFVTAALKESFKYSFAIKDMTLAEVTNLLFRVRYGFNGMAINLDKDLVAVQASEVQATLFGMMFNRRVFIGWTDDLGEAKGLVTSMRDDPSMWAIMGKMNPAIHNDALMHKVFSLKMDEVIKRNKSPLAGTLDWWMNRMHMVRTGRMAIGSECPVPPLTGTIFPWSNKYSWDSLAIDSSDV